MPEDRARIEQRQLSVDEINLVKDVKWLGNQFIHLINAQHWKGREMSVAITKIEEAVMWAVKGITA
jgi:hypothetical protein